MSEETVNSLATPEETEPQPANVSEPTPAEEETLVAPVAGDPRCGRGPRCSVWRKRLRLAPVVRTGSRSLPEFRAAPAAPQGVDVLNFGDKPDPARGRRKVRVGRVVSKRWKRPSLSPSRAASAIRYMVNS